MRARACAPTCEGKKNEMYLLTTSPSGRAAARARPLASGDSEVAKRYIFLENGSIGFDFREALPYADQCAAAVAAAVLT
jgi:hypothetical protein